MRGFSHRHGIVGLAMIAAAILTLVVTPRQMSANLGPKLDLEAAIPKQFGAWRELPGVMLPVSADPELQETQVKIYNQVLMRTYGNEAGDRVMLAIAYGSDQSDSMQVHKPEVCYSFQGFQVIQKGVATLDIAGKSLPVKHLVAMQGGRVEPITYWIKVGDEVVRGGIEQKLAKVRYGLSGTIPDGMLIRVSTIQQDPSSAYQLQTGFINELQKGLSPEHRYMLIGRSTLAGGEAK